MTAHPCALSVATASKKLRVARRFIVLAWASWGRVCLRQSLCNFAPLAEAQSLGSSSRNFFEQNCGPLRPVLIGSYTRP